MPMCDWSSDVCSSDLKQDRRARSLRLLCRCFWRLGRWSWGALSLDELEDGCPWCHLNSGHPRQSWEPKGVAHTPPTTPSPFPSSFGLPLTKQSNQSLLEGKEGPDWGRKAHHGSLPKGCPTAWASRALSQPLLGHQVTCPPPLPGESRSNPQEPGKC